MRVGLGCVADHCECSIFAQDDQCGAKVGTQVFALLALANLYPARRTLAPT